MRKSNQSGNILFLILIAVALFAALSYAVTQSSRGSGDNASKEKDELAAAQIMQYSTLLKSTISRLMISNGCTPEEISFENPIVPNYTNPNSPPSLICNVFHPNGGNLAFVDFKNIVTSYGGLTAPENVAFATTNIDGQGGEDLIFFIRGGLSKSLCDKINTKLGHPLSETWDTGGDSLHFFTGDMITSYDYQLLSPITDGGGKCYFDGVPPTSPGGAYVHVLIPR